jgi:hypothetical protein
MSTNPLPDNRIRIPAPPIDFSEDVGDTGQDHDRFPDPGQARYDWMRMFLIGLLANQASYREPVNYRKGTFWMDLDSGILKIRTGEGVAGTEWSDIAELIEVSPGLTLQGWFDAVSSSLAERLVSTAELSAALQEFFTADVGGNILSFVMAAPNGSRYNITINNSGEWVKTLLS